MRLITVIVPSDKREEVIDYLERNEIGFGVTEETSGRNFSDVITFPAHSDEVEEILDGFRELGVNEEGHIVVTEAQAVLSDRFAEEKEEKEEKKESEEGGAQRIAREELKAKSESLSRSTPNYILFTLVSAVVATAGLITDSASIVVGSMVIAPLIGPAMASSVGSVINDDDLFIEGVKSQFVGIGVAVLSATAFAVAARFLVVPELQLRLIDQVAERIHPGILSLAVALGSGVAGALSLTSGMSAALVGVMIAVALIPPAATVGLGIAYLDIAIAVSSAVLLLINVLSINLSALVTLWLKGYRPEKWYEEKVARRVTLQRVGALILGVLILTSFLVATTLDARQNQEFEREVRDVLEGSGAEIISIEFIYTDGYIFRTPEGVRVRVDSRASNAELAEAWSSRIQDVTGNDVRVTVINEEVATSS